MLKYFNLINSMKLNDKIKLLIANKDFSNNKVGKYEFPEMKFQKGFLNISSNYQVLTNTFDKNLFNQLSDVLKTNEDTKNIILNFNLEDFSSMSSSAILNVTLINALIDSVKKNNGLVCIENIDVTDVETFTKLHYDKILSNNVFAVSTNIHALKDLRTFYKGLVYINCETKEDVIKAINEKAYIIGDLSNDDVLAFVNEAIKDYKSALHNFSKGKITKDEFNELISNNEVLDESALDASCDYILGKLYEYENSQKQEEFEPEDLTKAEDVLQKISDESIILLKNDKCLPASLNKSLAFFGDTFEELVDEISFQTELTKTVVKFEGYAPLKLSGNATDIAKNADTLICFVKKDETYDAQVECISELAKINPNIVVVLFSSSLQDNALADVCKALLYVPSINTKYTVHSILNILTGELNPSGKISSLYDTIDKKAESIEFFSETERTPLYKFGYGLSYAKYIYSNFELKNNQIKIKIENTNKCPGKELFLIYLKRGNENTKHLIGFEKITLGTGVSNFRFPVSLEEFAVFNAELKKFEILEGDYEISVECGESGEVFKNTLHLEHAVLDSDSINLEHVSFSEEEFAFDASGTSKKKYKFKTHLLFLLLFTLIIMGTLSYFLYVYYYNDPVSYSIIGGMIFYGLIFLIRFIVINKKRRKTKKNNKKKNSLENILNSTQNLNVVAKVSYETPITDVEVEETSTSEYVENQNISEVKTETSEQKEEEIVEDEIDIIDEEPEEVEEEEEKVNQDTYEFDLEELAINVSKYLSSVGIILPIKQLRVLLSSLFTSRVLYLNPSNKDLEVTFFEKLSKLFKGETLVVESELFTNYDAFKSAHNHELRSFINIANKNKNHLNFLIVKNVTNNEFKQYERFIQSGNSNLDTYINLSTNFKLGKNICYIFIPKYEHFLENIEKSYLDKALTLSLDVSTNEFEEEFDSQIYLSLDYIEYLIKTSLSKNFLEEDQFKQIDDFEDAVKLKEKNFKLTNKTAVLIEQLGSLLLSFGVDKTEIIDEIVSIHIVPLLKKTKLYSKNNGFDELKEMLIKTIGEDNISKTSVVLAKRNVVQEEDNIAQIKIVEPTKVVEETSNVSEAEVEQTLVEITEPNTIVEETAQSPEDVASSETSEETVSGEAQEETAETSEEAPLEETTTPDETQNTEETQKPDETESLEETQEVSNEENDSNQSNSNENSEDSSELDDIIKELNESQTEDESSNNN